MNREALRQQAQGRRNEVNDNTVVGKWECHHCKHTFVSEKVFMNHRCREQKRNEELKSIVGQAAYAYYSEWMRQKKRSVPPIETFAESMFYTTFIKFAEHAIKTNIPNVPQFIKIMVEHNDVSPSLWCRDSVYSMYLTWYDTIFPPENQFLDSMTFIEELIADYDCQANPGKIFNEVDIDKLVKFIKKRKLSPWFLLSSKSFRDFLASAPPTDKTTLEASLNIGAMISQIQKKPDLFKMFNQATAEMKL